MRQRVTLLLLVLLAAGCPGGLKAKLCGGVGQPCCTELPACDEGGRCGATDTCVACGAAGQPCCAGETCEAGSTCTNDVCAQNVTCSSPCTLGAGRCSATGGLEECIAGGVCPAWRAIVTTCPTGTTCSATASAAECVEQCPTSCIPDALQCTVTGLKRCVLPGGASCPTLTPEADDTDRPQCVTGATVGTDLVWESPTPLHTPLLGVAGDLAGSFWVVDALGNIVHNALGAWEYEVRGTPGKRARAIASCGLGSRLYAVGEGGAVYKRGYGAWTEENVGASVTLEAVACDSNERALATGSDGRLYVRGTTGWQAFSTGATGAMHGLAYLFGSQRAFLVGNGGEIVRCTGLDQATPTCAAEASGTGANLLGAWGDSIVDQAFAVGAQGTLLVRASAGTWQPIATQTTAALRAVHGYYDGANSRTVVVAVGDDGAYVARPYTTAFLNTVAAEGLSGVMALNANHVFVASSSGTLWYTDQVSPLPSTPFQARGGRKPIDKTLRAVAGLGLGRLFAVGDDGARYRRDNLTWLQDGAGLAVTTALNGVDAVSAGEVYAVGEGGRVLVRRYGTWSDDAPGLTTKALSAVAHDAARLVAVGADGTWLEKVRAGGAWQAVAQTASAQALYAVAVQADVAGAAQEFVAVGADCTVLSKRAGAISLVPVPVCPAGTTLRAAAFTSAGELYVAGSGAVVLKRTASGFTREYLDASTLETVRALVPQGTGVWALLERGQLFRRSTAWAAYAPGVTAADLLGGHVDRDEGLFVVGGRGLVLRRP